MSLGEQLGRRCAVLILCSICCGGMTHTNPSDALPKYGNGSTPLSKDYAFLRTHEAPLFWHLIAHYVGQPTDSACSVAAATTVLNALLTSRLQSRSVRLLTTEDLLTLEDKGWREATAAHGT